MGSLSRAFSSSVVAPFQSPPAAASTTRSTLATRSRKLSLSSSHPSRVATTLLVFWFKVFSTIERVRDLVPIETEIKKNATRAAINSPSTPTNRCPTPIFFHFIAAPQVCNTLGEYMIVNDAAIAIPYDPAGRVQKTGPDEDPQDRSLNSCTRAFCCPWLATAKT